MQYADGVLIGTTNLLDFDESFHNGVEMSLFGGYCRDYMAVYTFY